MKVYMVKANYDYDGFEILGIFREKEDAEKCLLEEEVKKNGVDSYVIENWLVE